MCNMTATDLDRTTWFRDARFGMFIHYGLYSVAGRHEWVQNYESIGADEYRTYFDHFEADRFNAQEWARAVKAAGMQYVVLTSKHHEGFCLWDSEHTEFSAPHSPAGRDLVDELVTACRAEGLRVGLYYSLLDWHHPDFPLDGFHPDWKDRATIAPRPGDQYVEYLHRQVEELITTFAPDVLWFDFSYPGDRVVEQGKGADFWDSQRLFARIRELAPDVLINDRLDLAGSGDFITPEEVQPTGDIVNGEKQLWEACRTLNGSWGYAPTYQNWLDAGQVLRLLIDSVSKGGNLLLNVGPTGRGDIEKRANDLLHEVGVWMELHESSIRGAGVSSIVAPEGCRVTERDGRVFVHIFDWPTGHLVFTGLPSPLEFARFVHDGVEVRYDVVPAVHDAAPHEVAAGPAGSTVLKLPRSRPDVLIPVIELDFGRVPPPTR
ncbi:alpha-L-fucosidase [Plantibacter sp. YIM 135347]|uniref:alpha-L-fucosidase n=1 Tax=Plantibacter sp. YIM 135347 TaxID=3423919 RepID=UPI003D341132